MWAIWRRPCDRTAKSGTDHKGLQIARNTLLKARPEGETIVHPLLAGISEFFLQTLNMASSVTRLAGGQRRPSASLAPLIAPVRVRWVFILTCARA